MGRRCTHGIAEPDAPAPPLYHEAAAAVLRVERRLVPGAAAPTATMATRVARTTRAYGLYASSGQTPFGQGRYLFSALVPFAVLTGAGLHRLLGRWSTVSLLAAAGLQAVALHVVLRTWWAEPEASLRRSVAAMLAWNPWPRLVVLAAMVAGLTAGTALAAQCGRRRSDPL